MKNEKLIAIVLVAVGLGVGFFGGMQYQKNQVSSVRQFGGNTQGRGGTAGRNGTGGIGAGIRPVLGDIISSDDKSITVKLTDGSSKIILISASTTINKAAQATAGDLKTGEKVAVFGTANSDGSITAQSVQLNPMQRMMGGGQNGQQSTQSGQGRGQ